MGSVSRGVDHGGTAGAGQLRGRFGAGVEDEDVSAAEIKGAIPVLGGTGERGPWRGHFERRRVVASLVEDTLDGKEDGRAVSGDAAVLGVGRRGLIAREQGDDVGDAVRGAVVD